MTPQEAEILKLARLLGAPPDRFGYLAQVPVADLRALRDQVTGLLFDAHLGALEKMAIGSRLLPGPVLARMAERSFGPLLSARLAGLVEPHRGIDIAKRLSAGFLADVAAELDPRRAAGIIAGLPDPVVLAVASELSRREDWVTIARFLDHLPEAMIEAALEVMPEAALPRIVPMLDNPSRVARLSSLLSAEDFPGGLAG